MGGNWLGAQRPAARSPAGKGGGCSTARKFGWSCTPARRRLVARVGQNHTGKEFLYANIRAHGARRMKQIMQVATVMAILSLVTGLHRRRLLRRQLRTAKTQAKRRANQATASRLESEALAMLSQGCTRRRRTSHATTPRRERPHPGQRHRRNARRRPTTSEHRQDRGRRSRRVESRDESRWTTAGHSRRRQHGELSNLDTGQPDGNPLEPPPPTNICLERVRPRRAARRESG